MGVFEIRSMNFVLAKRVGIRDLWFARSERIFRDPHVRADAFSGYVWYEIPTYSGMDSYETGLSLPLNKS
jgi:hypothetical protein